jgi:hypothetical protein
VVRLDATFSRDWVDLKFCCMLCSGETKVHATRALAAFQQHVHQKRTVKSYRVGIDTTSGN